MVKRTFFNKTGLEVSFEVSKRPLVRITGFTVVVSDPDTNESTTFVLPANTKPSAAYANYYSSLGLLVLTAPHNPENNYDRELYVAQHD
jgi:hypothetical protein